MQRIEITERAQKILNRFNRENKVDLLLELLTIQVAQSEDYLANPSRENEALLSMYTEVHKLFISNFYRDTVQDIKPVDYKAELFKDLKL